MHSGKGDNVNLYEITKELLEFRFEIDEETGEILNIDKLDELKMARDEKIEQLLLWVKNLRAEAKAIKEESENLKDRYKRIEKKADKIEDYVSRLLNGEKFSTSKVEVKWRKSESVIIPDEVLVPDNFVNLSIVRKPVKAAIKKYLKSLEGTDEKCEWATLEVKNNMSIK